MEGIVEFLLDANESIPDGATFWWQPLTKDHFHREHCMPDMNTRPSLCLIGTSNAVFDDGYSRSFANSPYLSIFSKHALGFSSSLMFPLMAKHADPSKFDICVLDFAVNDGTQLAGAISSPDLIMTAVEDAVVHILKSGCMPALFVMPVLSLYKSPNNIIRKLYMAIASKFNIPIYDGYSYLEHVQSSGKPVDSLFKDNMHLHRDIAAELAASFLDGLLLAHRMRMAGRQICDSGFTYEYLPIDRLDVDPGTIRDRRTRLFAAGIADIRDAMQCRVDGADATTQIVGMGVDWANTTGTLYAASSGTVTLNINNIYSGTDEQRFIFGVYPWPEPLHIEDGVLTLSVKPNDKSDARARIALGGLVVRRPADYSVTSPLERPLIVSDALFSSNNALSLRDVKRWKRPVYYFENMDSFLDRKKTSSALYSIKILRTFFDVLVEDRKSDTTIVVFHAEIPNRAEVKLPLFAEQQLTVAAANVIHVSDPALYASDRIPLAWFAGRKGCPVQAILRLILQSLISELGARKLVFTGPSGGGFAALYYSFFFSDSLAVPSNPQTIIGNSDPSAVAAYCLACFGISDGDEAGRLLRTGIDASLPDLYGTGMSNYVIYCQNDSDDHVELQEMPFRKAIAGRDAERVVYVHGDWGVGHVSPPATAWDNLLSAAANWRGEWPDFLRSHDFGELGTASRDRPAAGMPASLLPPSILRPRALEAMLL